MIDEQADMRQRYRQMTYRYVARQMLVILQAEIDIGRYMICNKQIKEIENQINDRWVPRKMIGDTSYMYIYDRKII